MNQKNDFRIRGHKWASTLSSQNIKHKWLFYYLVNDLTPYMVNNIKIHFL